MSPCSHDAPRCSRAARVPLLAQAGRFRLDDWRGVAWHGMAWHGVAHNACTLPTFAAPIQPAPRRGREKLKAELASLEAFKLDQELCVAMLTDKLAQARLENERLLQEVERFSARISSATRDYVSCPAGGRRRAAASANEARP